jgi:hypothetical protein
MANEAPAVGYYLLLTNCDDSNPTLLRCADDDAVTRAARRQYGDPDCDPDRCGFYQLTVFADGTVSKIHLSGSDLEGDE